MLLPIVGLLVGLAVLTWAAELFVVGAARTAAHLDMSPVIIGAVVIGIGTSAPELVVSGLAAADGRLEIAVGNVVGSNLANLTLVLGVAALAASITVASSTLRREAPLSLASVLLFGLLAQDGLSRIEGVVLLVVLVAVVWYLVASARNQGNEALTGEVGDYVGPDVDVHPGRELGRALAGLVGTVAAAQVLVWSAITLAAEFGLAEGFVGLTVVAIGTSLPELATSLQAARRDETDLIIGNLLGSNLFNSLAVGGAAAVLGPRVITDTNLTGIAVVLMVVAAVLATTFMVSGRRVTRREGIALLVVYAITMPLAA